MKKCWVDFKHINESVSFELVIAHYGIQVKPAKGESCSVCVLVMKTRSRRHA